MLAHYVQARTLCTSYMDQCLICDADVCFVHTWGMSCPWGALRPHSRNTNARLQINVYVKDFMETGRVLLFVHA